MKTISIESPSQPSFPAFAPRTQILILISTTVLILLFGSFDLPLVDRDEPRFAQATQEMLHRHDYLVPYFNGEYRFDKPPFIYWNMAIFYGLFGVHEITARLPAILHTLLLVLATYQIGRKFFSAKVGFYAAFGLVTCLQIMIHGRLAVADMPMIFDLTVAQALLMTLLLKPEEEQSRATWILFYLFQALGFLAKGPVVQAVTFLTLLIFRFVLWRRPLPWHRLRVGLGLPLMIGLVGLWGIPALVQTHGLWWRVGIGEHVVGRGMESFNGRSYFAPYYLVSSLFSLCPWIAFVGYGWQVLRQNWHETNAFLCSWILGTYLLFTCYSTQLPHYVMPAFPAFFLILAQMADLRPSSSGWPRWFSFGLRSLYFLLTGFLFLLSLIVPDRPLEGVFRGLFWVFLSLNFLLYSYQNADRRCLTISVLLLAGGWFIVGVNLRPLAPALPISRIAASLPPGSRMLARGFTEPSLVFYTDRHWALDQSLPEIQSALGQGGPGLIIEMVEERSMGQGLKWLWARIWRATSPPLQGRDFSPEIDPALAAGWKHQEVTGLNLARSSWVRLQVYYREQ